MIRDVYSVWDIQDQCITLKTSIKYQKEYDRNTEKKLLALLQENENANDFSWESKIEEADEIRKAQGSMPQLGMGVTYFLYQSMNYRGVAFSIPLMPILLAVLVSFLTGAAVPVFTWMVLEKSGTVVERIRGII